MPSPLSESETLPRPPSLLQTHDEEYAGLRLVSGTGEELGVVVGVELDRFGSPKWLSFQEAPDAPLRKVRLEMVRAVADGVVRLAGPREGYHITRLH